jgi:hypothetical protein
MAFAADRCVDQTHDGCVIAWQGMCCLCLVDRGCRWEREERKSSWREGKGTYKSVIERHLDWRVGADPPIGYVAD